MIRPVSIEDIEQLVALENSCFDSDRISRRSFRYLITRANADILVEDSNGGLAGYVLVLYHRGTSLARLYSIAVSSQHRNTGVARRLVQAAEQVAVAHECITLRLEIRTDNIASIRLFESLGYRQFGRYLKYYEDEADAVRLEKRLISNLPARLSHVPYYQQTLEFTCGPSCIMMAMKALDDSVRLSRLLELRLWRESTTIYMTSGHGGCGPYGMALALHHRGFRVRVYVKEGGTMFIDSVRSEEKKEVIRLVEKDFLQEIRQARIPLSYNSLTVDRMVAALREGAIPVILISSYRIYKEKFPHWVVVTGSDDRFIYVHDPYIDEEKGKTVTDCVNMPIGRHEFERMTRYGRSGQRAALLVYPKHKPAGEQHG